MESLVRWNEYFQSRIQKYQSDRRLQLLLSFTVASAAQLDMIREEESNGNGILYHRIMEILLEDDDHGIRLVDQDALDLRHAYPVLVDVIDGMLDIMSLHVDGKICDTAALHCMCFLSNPPCVIQYPSDIRIAQIVLRKYFERNGSLEIDLMQVEWRESCIMALRYLCYFLKNANTSQELVRFLINHDMHPEVQKCISVIFIWRVDVHILAFLSVSPPSGVGSVLLIHYSDTL